MSEPITWEMILTLSAVVSIVGGVWWKLQARIQQCHNDLSEFKLEVAEKYASGAQMKEVETRLIASIEKLESHIDKLIETLLDRRQHQ